MCCMALFRFECKVWCMVLLCSGMKKLWESEEERFCRRKGGMTGVAENKHECRKNRREEKKC